MHRQLREVLETLDEGASALPRDDEVVLQEMTMALAVRLVMTVMGEVGQDHHADIAVKMVESLQKLRRELHGN